MKRFRLVRASDLLAEGVVWSDGRITTRPINDDQRQVLGVFLSEAKLLRELEPGVALIWIDTKHEPSQAECPRCTECGDSGLKSVPYMRGLSTLVGCPYGCKPIHSPAPESGTGKASGGGADLFIGSSDKLLCQSRHPDGTRCFLEAGHTLSHIGHRGETRVLWTDERERKKPSAYIRELADSILGPLRDTNSFEELVRRDRLRLRAEVNAIIAYLDAKEGA
jgi:hypothetical protein